MKTRDEFIKDVFEKSERLRAAEAAACVRKKQRLRVVMGTVSAAACLTLVVGLSGMLDDAFWTRGNDAAAGDAAGEPVILQVQNDGAMQDLEGAEAEADSGYEADAAESARQEGNTGDTDMDSRKMNGFTDERAVDDSGAKAAAQTQTQGGQDMNGYADDDAAALWSRDALWETNAQVRDLSVRLFKNAASAKQNSMISPTSILLAMAMVENGAAGDTKKQMEKTFGMRMSELNQWIRAWSAVQPQEDADTRSRMNIANAVWYNNRGALTLNPDYQKTLREMLQAQVKGGDFSQQTVKEINSWCSKNTYGSFPRHSRWSCSTRLPSRISGAHSTKRIRSKKNILPIKTARKRKPTSCIQRKLFIVRTTWRPASLSRTLPVINLSRSCRIRAFRWQRI